MMKSIDKRPNAADLRNARKFAREMLSKRIANSGSPTTSSHPTAVAAAEPRSPTMPLLDNITTRLE